MYGYTRELSLFLYVFCTEREEKHVFDERLLWFVGLEYESVFGGVGKGDHGQEK